MENIYCKEYLLQASNEELIAIYRQYNCSFLAIQKAFDCSKNMVDRLYIKRNIDYHLIKELLHLLEVLNYYTNPKYCINCGDIIPYENRHNKYCNLSCAATYNNKYKRTKDHVQCCVYCGKPLKDFQKWNDLKYCSLTCRQLDIYNKYIEKWKVGEEDGTQGMYGVSPYIRKYLFEKYNHACLLCGWNKVNPVTFKVPLQIHHIDGNCLNNKEENLLLLCPNCHSLTETFGSLNKSSARIFRAQKGNI